MEPVIRPARFDMTSADPSVQALPRARGLLWLDSGNDGDETRVARERRMQGDKQRLSSYSDLVRAN